MRSSINPLVNRVVGIHFRGLTKNYCIPSSTATRFRLFNHTSTAGLSVSDFSAGAVRLSLHVSESRLVRVRGLSTAAAVEVEQPRRRRTLKTKDPIEVVSSFIIHYV